MEIIFIDKSTVLDLVDIFEELEHYYFKEQAASRAEIEDYLRNGLCAPHSGVQTIAALSNQQVLGFATFSILYPAPKLSGQAFMKDLFTRRSARGKGVGTQLIKFIAQYAIDHGCRRLDWTAESTNPVAGKFYTSLGADGIREKQYFRLSDQKLVDFAGADQV